MPELPEVETVCRGLEGQIIDHEIAQIVLHRPNLRYPFPEAMDQQLSKLKIKQIQRQAKYILIRFYNSDLVWITHLGMSGRFRFCDPTEAWQIHDHCVIHFKTLDKELRYTDPRRFGFMLLEKASDLCESKHFKHLGLDPFDENLTATYLLEKFKMKKSPIKTALMDQRIIAGLGNIYVCESLYWARIHPETSAKRISLKQLELLLEEIRKVLKKAIAAGGSSLRDYQNVEGELGYFQHQWAIYGKEGLACPNCHCDVAQTGGIKTIKQAGRTSFYCDYQVK